MAKPTKRRARKARVTVSPIAELKGALTEPGDIRSDIEFQNDVNALLATVSRMTTTFGPEGEAASAPQGAEFSILDDLVGTLGGSRAPRKELGPAEPSLPHAIVTATPSPVRHRRRAGDPR